MEEKVHILIGFHANETNYSKYHTQFLNSIQSLILPLHLKKTFVHLREQTPQERLEMMAYFANILSEDEDTRRG